MYLKDNNLQEGWVFKFVAIRPKYSCFYTCFYICCYCIFFLQESTGLQGATTTLRSFWVQVAESDDPGAAWKTLGSTNIPIVSTTYLVCHLLLNALFLFS